MVVHDRCRVKSQLPSAVLQSPAHVDVVPGNPELGVKTPDRFQAVSPEGHIATRDVFRFPVRQQDVFIEELAHSISDFIF